ncbi:N-acetyl-gamma-glutamyl-phosphate reductase [Thalassospira profundimaris]|uniref:N-acetyl-gamma-glutamyl-phosphate reductase n=1 Tax=Thalassospira profundimaris TaxID=502049 RepID=A0A367WYV6_9PROT|nr:N-acetyl-gamma-glutamyl-phosphate reductase [Thalassospira profundimaris]RCK46577.1 N-acetyl-gamma-glutamyl-phosphate reductase [Thalassospira profundimaris]
MSDVKVKVGILGASGYTGAELVRILAHHAAAEITLLTADRRAGRPFGEVFPHLAHIKLPTMISIAEADWSTVDVIFCALPHGTTQEVIAGLPAHVKVVDLSADFRLFDPATYKEWYGAEHAAQDLQKEVVYGLTELHREKIKNARVVANPGCYPTPVQLALTPLLEGKLVHADDIIIDAKSGVTGAGRAPKEGTLYAEVTEGIHAYGTGGHRHAPEIEQGLAWASGQDVVVNFSPHLMPMSRGILESIYVKMTDGTTAEDIQAALEKRFEGEPFVRVLPFGVTPQTRHVRGSNYVLMGVVKDRVPGRVIIVAVEDNLVKGASGQAVQNMNVMLGLPETMGLEIEPLFP